MSGTPRLDDNKSFPAGHDLEEIIAAVKFAATKHVKEVPLGPLDGAIVERLIKGLVARHPEIVPYGDPYQVRSRELYDERRSLSHSHLKLTWFALAYWAYGLIAVRSGLSHAEVEDPDIFVETVVRTLHELGVRISAEECLEEIDRFLPLQPTPRSIELATHVFLSFVRFLHHAALRRRQVVTPRLALPNVALTFAPEDAEQAETISTFLSCHGVGLHRQPDEVVTPARLLVLASRDAMRADTFWRSLAAWKTRPVAPMVLCLMPKAELYRDPPSEERKELWSWLAEGVAVELSRNNDRYVTLLRALDSANPRQWWWKYDDSVELGLAVGVLGESIPRPPKRAPETAQTGEPYPFSFDGTVRSAFEQARSAALACATEGLRPNAETGRDARYVEICNRLLPLRQKPGREPYSLPWFMLIYRAWLAFAARVPGFAALQEDPGHAELELRLALFALGIGTRQEEVPAFLESFACLPWTPASDAVAAVDDQTVAFTVLVHHLSQAALAAGQRVGLQHPVNPCFVSYARPDEDFARELVKFVEGKGADVWFDLNAITIGTPLDDSLRSAVADARFLLLVATPAADQSTYVRLERETAIRQGLHIIPIAPDSDRASAFAGALARLERTPEEQLRWLQSHVWYRDLRDHVAHRGGTGSP